MADVQLKNNHTKLYNVQVKVFSSVSFRVSIFSKEISGAPSLINKCACKHKSNSFSNNDSPEWLLWSRFSLIKLCICVLYICCSRTDCHKAETQLFRLYSCPEKGWLSNYKRCFAWDEWLCTVWPDKVITFHLRDSWAKLADLQATQALSTAGMCWKRDTPDIGRHQSTTCCIMICTPDWLAIVEKWPSVKCHSERGHRLADRGQTNWYSNQMWGWRRDRLWVVIISSDLPMESTPKS